MNPFRLTAVARWGKSGFFLFFYGQCIAHVNSVFLSYLLLVTNIPLLDLIDSTFIYA